MTRHLGRVLALCVLSIAATRAGVAGELTLVWAENLDAATGGYRVERVDADGYVLETWDAGDAAQLKLTGLADNTPLHLRVRPYDKWGHAARQPSTELVTFAAPRVDRIDGAPRPGQPATVMLVGANFAAGAQLIAKRSDVHVGAASVVNAGLVTATLTVDGGAALLPADLLIVNPVRRSLAFLRAHSELLDVDRSGQIDERDLAQIQVAFGAVRSQAGYLSALDVNGDGVVDGEDAATLQNWLTEHGRLAPATPAPAASSTSAEQDGTQAAAEDPRGDDRPAADLDEDR